MNNKLNQANENTNRKLDERLNNVDKTIKEIKDTMETREEKAKEQGDKLDKRISKLEMEMNRARHGKMKQKGIGEMLSDNN